MFTILLLTAVVLPASGQMTVCPSIVLPLWGDISCTDGTRPGSMCTLSCEEFYDLDDTTEGSRDAVCQEDGTWSATTEFSCTPIRCLPMLPTPTNGDLICSATNLVDSLCVYLCKDHYDLAGVDTDKSAYAVCKDDGDGDAFGEWMKVDDKVVFPPAFPPACDQIKCASPMESPENGQVICSAADYSGSTCVFYCDTGYRFSDSSDPVLFSSCKDDGNYDNVGKWTMPDVPTCEVLVTPGCGKLPEIKGVKFTCDSGYSIPGDKCSAMCESDMEEIKGEKVIVCNDRLKWETEGGGRMPKCSKCKRIKEIQLMALIHEFENDQKQYKLATKMITKIISVLKGKHRLNPTVRVNRYAGDVNDATEVYTTDFQLKRDRVRIEAIPFSTGRANTENALMKIDEKLREDDAVLVAFLLTNDLMDYGEAANKLAEDLRARGVVIFGFTIPQKRKILTWRKEDFDALTGSESMVYHIANSDSTEEYKTEVAMKIQEAAVKKGCGDYEKKE